MEMNKKYRNFLGISLFLINAILTLTAKNLDAVVGLLGSTSMPFIIFVIPGALYYTQLIVEDESNSTLTNKSGRCCRRLTWEKIGSVAFASTGLIFILFFVTICTHDFFDYYVTLPHKCPV